MEELIQKVLKNQSTLAIWKNDFKSEQWIDADNLHFQLFNSRLNQTKNCGCLNDFYKALNSKHKIDHIMNLENRNFLLKKDALVMIHREAKQFSHHSSEEDCIYLLSKYPERIKDFERYPSNWKEIVSAESDEQHETINEDLNIDRKNELLDMKSKDLKELIVSMGHEVPKGAKAVLVDFILKNEAEA